jgi:hypothetical protein
MFLGHGTAPDHGVQMHVSEFNSCTKSITVFGNGKLASLTQQAISGLVGEQGAGSGQDKDIIVRIDGLQTAA